MSMINKVKFNDDRTSNMGKKDKNKAKRNRFQIKGKQLKEDN